MLDASNDMRLSATSVWEFSSFCITSDFISEHLCVSKRYHEHGRVA